MKKILFASLALLSYNLCFSQEAKMTLSPEKPEVGKKLNFSFTSPDIDSTTTVSLIEHFFSSVPKRTLLNTTYENKVVKGNTIITDSSTGIIFLINTGRKTENNSGEGYVYNLYKNGEPVKGTYATEASMRGNNPFIGIKSDDKRNLELYTKEFNKYPELKKKYYQTYLYVMSQIPERKEEAIQLASKVFSDSLKYGNEEWTLISYGNIITRGRNQEKADSINELILKKYPKGEVYLNKARIDIHRTQDPKEAIEKYNKLNNEYSGSIPILYKKDLERRLLNAYIQLKDFNNFEKFIEDIQDMNKVSYGYNEMAWTLVSDDIELEKAKEYSKKSLTILEMISSEQKPPYYSEEQWRGEVKYNKGNYSDTYALIAYKLGNKKEALDYQLQSVELTNSNNPSINERLVEFLLEQNRAKDALNYSEKFIKARKGSEKIDSLFNVAYIKTNGSDKGLAELKKSYDEEINKVFKEELSKEILNQPSHDFTLKNLNGETVKLSALIGKIVILDFWATWCGPCIASFPGMQKSLNKYKDNKDVVFLFVNTSERVKHEERIKRIQELLDENKYTFNVLLDESTDDNFMVRDAYEISGIPTKIIIGKDGNIKFNKIGYGGNESDLVREMDIIIKMRR